MKVDMTAPILDLQGAPIVAKEGAINLRLIVQQALMETLKSDQSATGADKVRLFDMAMRSNADAVDFTVEEMATIKARIGELMTPLIVGRAYALLDPAT